MAASAKAAASTFVFADLAGFTALTEAHGDDESIEIAVEFVGRVRAMLPDHGAEEVKTIGDELMIRVDDPAEAVRLGMRIVDRLAFHGSPPVRVECIRGAPSCRTATGSGRRSTSPRGWSMRRSPARC